MLSGLGTVLVGLITYVVGSIRGADRGWLGLGIGIFITLALLSIAAGIGNLRAKRDAAPTGRPVTPQPEPPYATPAAPTEIDSGEQARIDRDRPSIDRFREGHNRVGGAVIFAYQEAVPGLLLGPSDGNLAYTLLYNSLFRDRLVPSCKNAWERIESDIGEPPAPLATLITDLHDLLGAYAVLVGHIERGGRAILGLRDFYESEYYAELRRRHRECLMELQRVIQTSGFRELYNSLGPLGDLLLVEPSPVGPRITLNGGGAFNVKRVTWHPTNGAMFDTDVLSVRLWNDPRSREDTAAATGLTVECTCQGPNLDLPWLHTRLDYPIQSIQMARGELPTLIYDFGVGEWKMFNLIIKEPESSDCCLYNNDSFQHPRVQNPAWRIGPGAYKVIVRVTGVRVREQFECGFQNPGQGCPLVVKSFRQFSLEEILAAT